MSDDQRSGVPGPELARLTQRYYRLATQAEIARRKWLPDDHPMTIAFGIWTTTLSPIS